MSLLNHQSQFAAPCEWRDHNRAYDLNVVTEAPQDDGGVPNGHLLVEFAEAVLGEDDAALSGARAELMTNPTQRRAPTARRSLSGYGLFVYAQRTHRELITCDSAPLARRAKGRLNTAPRIFQKDGNFQKAHCALHFI